MGVGRTGYAAYCRAILRGTVAAGEAAVFVRWKCLISVLQRSFMFFFCPHMFMRAVQNIFQRQSAFSRIRY